MLSPHSFEHLVTARHAELLREASSERLVSQAAPRSPHVRRRLAEALYNLAARVDPSCGLPAGTPASRPA